MPIAVFLILSLILSVVVAMPFPLPASVGVYYLAVSAVCFVMYAIDKQAAIRRAWRVPERVLIALSLLGGWPGGLLAQSLLRHKTSKASFQFGFWVSVFLNLALLWIIWTPMGDTAAWQAPWKFFPGEG